MTDKKYQIVLIKEGKVIPQTGINIPSKAIGEEKVDYLNSLLPDNMLEEEHYELRLI